MAQLHNHQLVGSDDMDWSTNHQPVGPDGMTQSGLRSNHADMFTPALVRMDYRRSVYPTTVCMMTQNELNALLAASIQVTELPNCKVAFEKRTQRTWLHSFTRVELAIKDVMESTDGWDVREMGDGVLQIA
jgi:hypothetical protein